MSAQPKWRHGFKYGYDQGCRCDACREATRAKRKHWRDRARVDNSPAYQRELAASRVLKKRYGGHCQRCGAPTSHGNSRNPGPSQHCQSCAGAIATENAFWTRDRLIDAARRWAAIHGHAPAANEWRNADREFPHPAFADCYGHGGYGKREGWGTWNDFIRAAGLEPRRPGERIKRTPGAVPPEATSPREEKRQSVG